MSEVPKNDIIVEKEAGKENKNEKCDFNWYQIGIKSVLELTKIASEADEKLEEIGICGGIDDLMDNYSDTPYNEIKKPTIQYISNIINKSDVNNSHDIIKILNDIGIYNIKEGQEINVQLSTLEQIIMSQTLETTNSRHHLKENIIEKYQNTQQTLENIPKMNEDEINNLIATFFVYHGTDRRYYEKNQLEPIIVKQLKNYPTKEKLILATSLVKGEVKCISNREGVIYLDERKNSIIYLGIQRDTRNNEKGTIISYDNREGKNVVKIQGENRTYNTVPWTITKKIQFKKPL